MPLNIKAEALPGDSITHCAIRMRALATRLGVHVEVEFNDVTLIATPGCDPQKLIDGFHAEAQSANPVKVVVA